MIPYAQQFAVIFSLSELLVCVSIILGLFTRFCAALGKLVTLHYAFTVGVAVWMPHLATLLIWALFTLMVCSAGRGMGADQILRSRRRIRLFT